VRRKRLPAVPLRPLRKRKMRMMTTVMRMRMAMMTPATMTTEYSESEPAWWPPRRCFDYESPLSRSKMMRQPLLLRRKRARLDSTG